MAAILLCGPARAADAFDPEIQARWETLGDDLKNIARFQKFRDETLHPAALIGTSDRDPLDIVLRRTRVLLADIRQMTGAPDMGGFEKRLTECETTRRGRGRTDR